MLVTMVNNYFVQIKIVRLTDQFCAVQIYLCKLPHYASLIVTSVSKVSSIYPRPFELLYLENIKINASGKKKENY